MWYECGGGGCAGDSSGGEYSGSISGDLVCLWCWWYGYEYGSGGSLGSMGGCGVMVVVMM